MERNEVTAYAVKVVSLQQDVKSPIETPCVLVNEKTAVENEVALQRPVERPETPLPRIPTEYTLHLTNSSSQSENGTLNQCVTEFVFQPYATGSDSAPANEIMAENQDEEAFRKPRVWLRGNRQLQKSMNSQSLIMATLGPLFAYDCTTKSPRSASQASALPAPECQLATPTSGKRPSAQ